MVAILDGNRVVLQLREDARMWNLPGGAVEDGESLAQAAVREVHEETGLHVHLTRLVGTYSRPRWRGGGDHQVLFAAVAVGGDLALFEPAETLDARFFDVAELPNDLIWWHRQLIEDALAAGPGAVARQTSIEWPYSLGRAEAMERIRHDPAFAAEVRATFSQPCVGDSTQLEVGPDPSPR